MTKKERREYNKQQQKKRWLAKHPEYKREYSKKWHAEHPEYSKQYYAEHKKDPEYRKKRNKIGTKYHKRRYHNDLAYKLSENMSTAIYKSLKGNKNGYHWETLVGYTLEQLKEYLESLFRPGMSWENYGEWHIDHIIPISLWKFSSPEDREFKQCWALANLQPLWWEDNIRKGNKIVCS